VLKKRQFNPKVPLDEGDATGTQKNLGSGETGGIIA
jgi:hypothetical protein